jgi:hypothetical protein
LWDGTNHRIEQIGEQQRIHTASSESAKCATLARLVAQSRNARRGGQERHRWRKRRAEFFDKRISHAQRFERAQEDEAAGGKSKESRPSTYGLFH